MQGTTLGPFRIDAELGSGGMGNVYSATVEGRAPGLAVGTRVALKVVHPHLLDTPGFFKRFLREGEIGRSVVHENVVRTYDCDAVREHHFLVMEYVEGQTLRALLAELDRVPEELCRHIGREVAKGLGAIHAAGVVHRDVKPENVLITRDHVVKVMDLGVARLANEALRLSQTGAFVGSIHYAAPEQFRGPAPRSREGAARSAEGVDAVDGRADLHALGLVLYELSCGTNPYLADDLPRILEKILREEPRRLGDVNPQLSPFFEEVVHNLLAKKPSDRFADATTLARVLEEGEKSDWWTARAQAIRAVTQKPLRRIRVPRETAVYGRDREMTLLRSLYERASKGEGQVALVEGEAGIGKSRVVDELIGRLQQDGEDVNFLFGSYPPGGAATAAGAFSTAFREQFGDAGSSDHLGQTPILAPAFDALLRGETTPSGCEPLTKESIHTCFVNATRSLAAERTTVVLVDDLHFAPDEGRALFAALAMAVPGHRVLLVGTTRPGVDENWLAQLTRLPQTTQVALPRLGPKDLVRLLADTLRSDRVAAELSAQIALKSDGNPFFVFEILRGLREGQFLTQRADGTWVTTRVIDEIRIPSSVLDLVNARVADLSAEERDLLDVACCLGFEFDPGLVGEVLGVGRIPLLKRFGQIERAHRLVRAAGRNYVFDHHQVQEALYGSLHEQLREEYHAALASALELRHGAVEGSSESLDGALCVDLCEHFLKGAAPDRALRYLAPAHAHLWKGFLNAQAVALAERALAVPGLLAGAGRAKALLRLCEANGPLDRLGRRARQEEAAREAERLAGQAGDDAMCGLAARALGNVLVRTSRHAEAEAAHGRALAIARALGDRQAEAATTGHLGLVFEAQDRVAQAREHYERCLAICRDIGDRRVEAAVTGNLGNLLRAEGRLAESREHQERALAINREIGNRQGEAIATGNLGNALQHEGRFAQAQERHERHLVLVREIGDRRGEVLALANLSNAFYSQGRSAEAREYQERSLDLSREIGDARGEATALHNLGTALRDEGETAPAQVRLLACLALCNETGSRNLAASAHLVLGSARAEAGDADGARASLAAARDLAATIGAPGYETLARCRLACLPGGDDADALTAFAANAERLQTEERIEARWLLWKATADRTHLAEAKRLLDDSLAKVPAEYHEAMLGSVRVNREIAAAANAAGL